MINGWVMEFFNKMMLLFFISFCFINLSADSTKYVGNHKYLIKKDMYSFEIYDIKKNQMKTVKRSLEIVSISFLPESSFISIIEKDKYENLLTFYDVETNKSFLWGVCPHYYPFFVEEGRSIVLATEDKMYIVKIDQIGEFIQSRENNARDEFKKGYYIKIEGHPLGFLDPLYIIGKYFIYGNGVDGERFAFFAFDMDSKNNYFIVKCGFEDDKCSNLKISDIFFDKLKSGKLKKVSNNVFEAVSEILKKILQ